jgi:hypothetical protein
MLLEELAGVSPGERLPMDVEFTREMEPTELQYAVASFSRLGYTVVHDSSASAHKVVHVVAKRHRRSNE